LNARCACLAGRKLTKLARNAQPASRLRCDFPIFVRLADTRQIFEGDRALGAFGVSNNLPGNAMVGMLLDGDLLTAKLLQAPLGRLRTALLTRYCVSDGRSRSAAAFGIATRRGATLAVLPGLGRGYVGWMVGPVADSNPGRLPSTPLEGAREQERAPTDLASKDRSLAASRRLGRVAEPGGAGEGARERSGARNGRQQLLDRPRMSIDHLTRYHQMSLARSCDPWSHS
jgi:hypothetical protein